MREIIKQLLYEWKEKKLPNIIDRDININKYSSLTPKKIITIAGFRRSGKTYLLFQLIKQLLQKYQKKDIVYLNFEDERIPPQIEFLTEIIPTIKEVYSDTIKFLFLDEIQNIEGWSKWIRRTYDNEDFRIFVTGSSSKLSSREIPTELRGRALSLEVSPLSFKEFLKFKNIEVDVKAVDYSSGEKIKVNRALNEFLDFGGLPEVTFANTEENKTEILQSYYKTVVNRDIIERYNIKNENGLKALLRLLLNSSSFSATKAYDTLKSMNYKIGKTALLNYISYIENSYFMQSVEIFAKNVKDKMQYPRKIYFIDNGFINTLSLKLSKNLGRLYENLVFNELHKRFRDCEINYWKNQKHEEVDFIIRSDTKVRALIQVCYDLSDRDTKKRELRALIKAGRELRCNNLLIITSDHEAEEQIKDKKVIYIPLWKWLLLN